MNDNNRKYTGKGIGLAMRSRILSTMLVLGCTAPIAAAPVLQPLTVYAEEAAQPQEETAAPETAASEVPAEAQAQTTTVSGQIVFAGTETFPEAITVNLLANNVISNTIVITSETKWAFSFPDLPLADANGAPIVYTLEEVVPEGFVVTINGTTITNTWAESVKAEEEKKAEEAAPAPEQEQKAEEAAPAAEQEQKAEEAAPAAGQEQKAEEAAPTAGQEQKAEEAAPAPEQEQKAEDAAPAPEQEQKAEEAAPAAGQEQKAEEAAPAAGQEQKAEEAAPAAGQEQKAAEEAKQIEEANAAAKKAEEDAAAALKEAEEAKKEAEEANKSAEEAKKAAEKAEKKAEEAKKAAEEANDDSEKVKKAEEKAKKAEEKAKKAEKAKKKAEEKAAKAEKAKKKAEETTKKAEEARKIAEQKKNTAAPAQNKVTPASLAEQKYHYVTVKYVHRDENSSNFILTDYRSQITEQAVSGYHYVGFIPAELDASGTMVSIDLVFEKD